MSHKLWRIATDTPTYVAEDMSGTGASISGGRWNEPSVKMVYSATTRALACLETVVHLGAGTLPLNRYLVELTVPEDLWAAAEIVPQPAIGWDAQPAGRMSIEFGTAWAQSNRSAVLIVPSVIVPEEMNALINPRYPEAKRIKAVKVRKWNYDNRLRG